MLSIFLLDFFEAIGFYHLWVEDRGKCCPFFAGFFWGYSTLPTVG